jgi:manganese transport protein
MEGLIHRRIPLLVRRAITLVPALVLLGVGADPTWTLVVSQVVLSFGIPFAVIPLVRLNRDRSLMGGHANGPRLQGVLVVVVVLVVALNLALLLLLATGH